MPITKRDAPGVLPDAAKDIYVGAFNASYEDTCKDRSDRDACASKIAWAAVKKKYQKSGDNWVPKAALVEVELVITKASLQADGTMRWQATVSDVGPDATGERTSLALFRDWIERMEKGVTVSFLPPPTLPFLGVSHYPRLDGFGEAGITEKAYVDGKQFKAGGVFLDSPVGKAVFETLRAELDMVKRGEAVEQPVRISAAWWDLEHSHGDFVFTRRSLTDICPMCIQGVGDKVYLRGQPDHWASTRVPIHPRTSLALEEKSMPKIKRRDDAASIVGDDLADELEGKAQQLVGKSEAEEDTPGLVVKSEPDTEGDPSKAGVEEVMYDIPLGGALSMADAEAFIEAREVMDRLYTNWDLFRVVADNIFSAPADVDKVDALSRVVREFGDRVATLKANISDAYLLQPVARSNAMTDQAQPVAQPAPTTPPVAAVNDPAAVLGTAVKAALENPQLTREARLGAIQEALNTYAGTVKARLDAVAPPAPGEEIAAAIEKSLGGFAEKLDLLLAKLDARAATPQPQATPQQKSFAPSGPVQPQAQPDLPVSPVTGQPSALTARIRRSVGIQ
jgi:cation transport regulator